MGNNFESNLRMDDETFYHMDSLNNILMMEITNRSVHFFPVQIAVVDLVKIDYKFDAIKLLRAVASIGLRDAKFYVDNICNYLKEKEYREIIRRRTMWETRNENRN